MAFTEPVLMELDQEAAATRRLLERIPDAQLGWKPHPKARSLGQLAVHIAQTQKQVATMLQKSSFEAAMTPETVPASGAEIVAMFDENLIATKQLLAGMSDEDLLSTWSLTREGKPIFSAPKIGVVRMIVLNHIYHHRGQLSTYLRTLDVPLPSVYGPTADENPFF